MIRRRSVMTMLLLICLSTVSVAEEHESPLLDDLNRILKRETMSVGLLLQNVADYQSDRAAGQNGFSIANFRASVGGRLDGSVGYFLQTNFLNQPALLDAVLRYEPRAEVAVDFGAFKAPFSAEFLTGAASIDFVNRSTVVSKLAPGRQIGVQVRGTVGDPRFNYSVGAFNGNGVRLNGNDGDQFMYAGRLQFRDTDRVTLGANAAFSTDDGTTLGGGFVPGFNGERLLLGGDVRAGLGRWIVASEFIWSRLDFNSGSVVEPYGFYVTAGASLTPQAQVLLRWDRFRPEGLAAESDLLLLGINVFPTTPTELQLNYIVPTKNNPDRQQVLINAQIAL